MKHIAALLTLLPCVALAANITVTTSLDNTTASDGRCTLREAIANVNAAAETTGGDCAGGSGAGDSIGFTRAMTIQLVLGQLTVQQDVSISAPPVGVHLSGGNKTRILEIGAGTTQLQGVTLQAGKADRGGAILIDDGAALELTTCTLRANTASTGGGGAVYNDGGTLTATTSVFSANKALAGGGGALHNTGTATLTGSTLKGNRARPGNGGAIENTGMLTMSACALTGNRADPGNGGGINTSGIADLADCTFVQNRARAGDGGGIVIAGNATLSDCALDRNIAGGDGGGLVNGGTAAVMNSTLSRNHAAFNGGGVKNDDAGSITFTGCTLNDNHAGVNAGVLPYGGGRGGCMKNRGSAAFVDSTITANISLGDGGGLVNDAYEVDGQLVDPYLMFLNCAISRNRTGLHYYGGGVFGNAKYNGTIIAGNVGTDPVAGGNRVVGGNCAGGGAQGLGHNLEDTDTCGFYGVNCFLGSGGTSICNTDPFLDPAGLRSNGGPTKTIALCTAPGVPAGCPNASPAIDAGDDSVTGPPDNLATDQRGLPRLSGAHVDIGAYEVQQ